MKQGNVKWRMVRLNLNNKEIAIMLQQRRMQCILLWVRSEWKHITHAIVRYMSSVVRGYCNCPGGELFVHWTPNRPFQNLRNNHHNIHAEVAKGQCFLHPTDNNCWNKLANCVIPRWTTNIFVLWLNWFTLVLSLLSFEMCVYQIEQAMFSNFPKFACYSHCHCNCHCYCRNPIILL